MRAVATRTILSLVVILVTFGCGKTVSDSDRDAIMSAISDGDCGAIEQIIRGGMNVNAVLEDGITLIIFAATEMNPAGALCLLDLGANPNIPDSEGVTALMMATEVETIWALIDAGADVNAQDASGYTALMYAQYPEVVRVLLEAGADPYLANKAGKSAFQHHSRNSEILTILNEWEEHVKSRGSH